MLCGIRLSSVATDCTVTCYMSMERSYFSPSIHILDVVNCPVSQKNMNLKPFLSLLFFEHGYLSYYKPFQPGIWCACP